MPWRFNVQLMYLFCIHIQAFISTLPTLTSCYPADWPLQSIYPNGYPIQHSRRRQYTTLSTMAYKSATAGVHLLLVEGSNAALIKCFGKGKTSRHTVKVLNQDPDMDSDHESYILPPNQLANVCKTRHLYKKNSNNPYLYWEQFVVSCDWFTEIQCRAWILSLQSQPLWITGIW